MGDQGLEVNLSLRSEGNGELVVSRLSSGYDQQQSLTSTDHTYAVTERTLEVELLDEQSGDRDCNLRSTHTNLRFDKLRSRQTL